MEGLEVTEINLKNAISITGEIRWDSEYYKKEYLENERKLQRHKTNKFSDLCHFIKKGIFDLPPSNYIDSGVPLIRTSEIKNPTIDFSTTVYISDKTNEDNNKTMLFPNDIVFTKIGAYIGDVAMLPNKFPKYNFSQNVTGAAIKKKGFAPFYLAFFLSTMGRNQILRSAMLSGQGKLELEDIRNYKVPECSNKFQNEIYSVFSKREELTATSQNLYNKAENILLQEIGLQDFTPSQDAVNIKSFKDSFGISGRLDAEYYQVKYEQIVEKIKSQKHSSLVSLVSISKSIEPGSAHYSDEKGLPFYRVSDYNKFGLSQPDKELTNAFVTENKELITKLKPKKDTILFSKDGSVGTAYLLREDLNGITSGAILHLQIKNTKEILPEYLTLALNSKLVQMQAERDAGGSIILHWRVSEIENVVVPIIPFDKQQQIAKMVEESFRLKTESEQLLETAKKAVEIAIEQDEQTAMKYLNTSE
ncbi:MAG: restriction endonuclease subunit S [Weeksellaceae bacterium]|nr:restriction endonuclease subunit S [Weeksellaceae bacterium]